MRALEPEVVDAILAAFEPLLPTPVDSHPLGCHRPRVDDRLCFRGVLIRLVTGASWVNIEAILDHQVSDTTLRARRDEWIAAGVFAQLLTEANATFDRVIGLDLSEVVQIERLSAQVLSVRPRPSTRGQLLFSSSASITMMPLGPRI
jgi:transposase